MRALNGIINYIGVITSEHSIESEKQESFLVQKAILDSNMPKFIADDYKIYTGILSDLFHNSTIKSQFINPKAITSPQLFGYVNKKTMEFNEGICSKALRGYFNDTSEDLKLLIFDGPVDTFR